MMAIVKQCKKSLLLCTMLLLLLSLIAAYNYKLRRWHSSVIVCHSTSDSYTIDAKDDIKNLLNSMVVATAFSSNHFNEALDMLGSVYYYLPRVKIIVYDLGLSSSQVKSLNRLDNLEVRSYSFRAHPIFGSGKRGLGGYTWKVHIINTVSRQCNVLLWLDTSMRIVKPLTNGVLQRLLIFPLIAGNIHNYSNIATFAVDSTIKYLNISREDMIGVKGFQANCLLFYMNNKTKVLLNKWFDCAIHRECLYGIGGVLKLCNLDVQPQQMTYNGCHRYDQVALNLLVAKVFGKEVVDQVVTPEVQESFLVTRKPTNDWRRYLKCK